MILFDLKCPHDHGFEAWFRDGATYEAQVSAGDIACPVCGDTRIAKAPMAPRIAKGPLGEPPAAESSDAGTSAADSRVLMVDEPLRAQLDAMRRHVEENCEAVGDKFAEEARKIHYGGGRPIRPGTLGGQNRFLIAAGTRAGVSSSTIPPRCIRPSYRPA